MVHSDWTFLTMEQHLGRIKSNASNTWSTLSKVHQSPRVRLLANSQITRSSTYGCEGEKGARGVVLDFKQGISSSAYVWDTIIWMSEEVQYGATMSGTQLFQMIAEAQCGATMSGTQKFQMSKKVQCGANRVWDTNASHVGVEVQCGSTISGTQSNKCRSAVWCNNVPPYHALIRCKIITSGRLLPLVMILYINESLNCKNLVVDHILFNKQKAVLCRGFFSV